MYTLIIDMVMLFILIINLVVLIFISAFLVKLRENQKEFLSDILNVLDNFGSPKVTTTASNRVKSWDQKFEEELDDYQRRIREDRGLVDPNK